jgi:Chain length determinant protein
MKHEPNQTRSLPIVQSHVAPNGLPPRGPVPRSDTSASRPGALSDASNSDASTLSHPTVFEAVSRYRVLFLIMAVLGLLAGVVYALHPSKEYRAEAFITMPQQVSLQGDQANSGQYLDSQVLLLQSLNVAQRAAKIANAAVNVSSFTANNFFGPESQIMVSPPTTAAPGTYGATIVGVTFSGSTPKIAQEGANADLEAYTQARAAAITAEDNSVINALGTSIGAVNYQLSKLGTPNSQYTASLQQQLDARRGALTTQQAQAVVNEDIDLAQQPSRQTAAEPVAPSNHEWSIDGAAGLIGGILLGAAVAFMLARRKVAGAGQGRPAAADREGFMPPTSPEPPRRTVAPPQQPWR